MREVHLRENSCLQKFSIASSYTVNSLTSAPRSRQGREAGSRQNGMITLEKRLLHVNLTSALRSRQQVRELADSLQNALRRQEGERLAADS